MSTNIRLGNILSFYYYQNLYYNYVDYNNATENFKFLLTNNSNQEEIEIINILLDINNILDNNKIIILLDYYFKYYNNNIALLDVNNDFFNKILLENNSINFGNFNFQIKHIPYYINWGSISPELLYKINNTNNNPENNYIVNFGPSIYDELGVLYKYIKYLTYNYNSATIGNISNLNNFINNDLDVDMLNVNLFFVVLDDPKELKYFINFSKSISNIIDIYRLKSIYNNIDVSYCNRINNNTNNPNNYNSLYNNYIDYIISNKTTINYSDISNNYNSSHNIKINIITIPTAEIYDEFDKTIIGLHIDKSLDVLYTLYNNLSTTKQNNSFVYIKTFSKSSIEKLYFTLKNNKFIDINNKIILSSKNIYNNFIISSYNSHINYDNSINNLNGIKNINSFNFNNLYIHEYIKNLITNGNLNLIYNKNFIDIENIENIFYYNLAYLNNLLINYLIHLTNSRNNDERIYKPENNSNNKYYLFNEYINYFNFNNINSSTNSYVFKNLINNLLDSNVLNKLTQTYKQNISNNLNINNITNRYNYYSLFEYNNDASNTCYWVNSISNEYIDSSLGLVNNLINNVYINNIIVNNINCYYYKNVTYEFSLNSLILNNLSEIFINNIKLENNSYDYNSYAFNNYKLYLKIVNIDFSINDLSFISNNQNTLLSYNYQEVSLNNLQFSLSDLSSNYNINNLLLQGYLEENSAINKFNKSNNFNINIQFYNNSVIFDLCGSNPYYHQMGISYEDPGVNVYSYNIIDNIIIDDANLGINSLNNVIIENIEFDMSSNVNYSVSGDYNITYYDTSNSLNSIIRNVNVSNINNLHPIITFPGNKVINHYKGLDLSYLDLSALCYSYVDSQYIDFSLNFNDASLNILGTHIAYYSATDSMNNDSSNIKIINVIDWIDLQLTHELSNNILTLYVNNLGSKDGNGDIYGYDYIRFMEITQNIIESNNILDGPSKFRENSVIEISNNKYYFVSELNLYNFINFNSITIDSSYSNSGYALDNYFYDFGYLGIYPSIKAKESYIINIDISNLPANKIYAILLDDGTFLTNYNGDNINEVIETFDNPSNNIVVLQL